MPKDMHNKLIIRLFDDISNRVKHHSSDPRILITGSIIDDVDLIKLIESCGGSVIADDLTSGSRYFWNDVILTDTDPLKAIAKRYIGNIPSPFMHNSDQRLEYIFDLIERYKVEAVIIYNLKFCTSHLINDLYIKKKLQENNIPVISIETDHTRSNFGQLQTVVETFIHNLR